MGKNQKVKRYIVNLLLAVDQLFNSLLGGGCDETYSSRLGRIKLKHGGKIKWYIRPFPYIVDRFLDWIDPGHSIDAIEWDEDPANGVFDND